MKPATQTKSKRGRPSSYDPSFCDKLIDYFSAPPYTREFQDVVTKSGSIAQVVAFIPADFPTLAGFAIEVQVHRMTLYQWSKKHPEFGEAYAWAELYQERYLTVNGVKGYISPQAYVWTSKNTIGWRDRIDQLLGGSVGLESSNGQGLLEEFKKVINDPRNERKS